MRGIFTLGICGLLTVGCSHVGNLDQSKLHSTANYTLSDGTKVMLPLQYKNWQWMMATYTVPVAQIEAMLPEKLKPVLVSPSKALISFGVLEYPDVIGLEPYDEWLISIPVQYAPSVNIPFLPAIYNPLFPHGVYKKGGNYIHYLPVTTAESHQAGSEIWGFPKVKREITCTENEVSKECKLFNQREEEMSLKVEKLPVSYRDSAFSYCSYTEKKKQLLRTCLPAKGDYGYSVFGKATVTFGKGEVADEMKALDINRSNPMQVFMGNGLHSKLPLEYERLSK